MAHDHVYRHSILSEYAEALSLNLPAEFVPPPLHELKFESPNYRPLEVRPLIQYTKTYPRYVNKEPRRSRNRTFLQRHIA